jgi:hypothetical protein
MHLVITIYLIMHLVGWYSILNFRISTILNIIPLELDHFEILGIRKFVFILVPGFIAIAFVFVFRCTNRKQLRSF